MRALGIADPSLQSLLVPLRIQRPALDTGDRLLLQFGASLAMHYKATVWVYGSEVAGTSVFGFRKSQ